MHQIDWQNKHFAFFQNTACEYFPCHPMSARGDFNCLFCFCPLYCKQDCGGHFTLLQNGKKDCSACVFPHTRESYGMIMQKLGE
ncbi:MAG: cysteine-rich small domain-containing protein [Oscillospiraceae bacterium]|nr:cysteine-rich small domain-containing protein [Oscillospiraceae bacterium]